MKLVLAEPKYFNDSISIISELVNEARFKITPNALELVAMDPANVAMIVFKFLSSAFTEYDVKKDAEIAVNLSSLKQVLKRVGASDMMTIELDDNSRLKIEIKSKTTRTFHLPLIDIEEKEQKVPELNFPLSVTIKSSIMNEAVEDAGIVADAVTFGVEAGKFTVSAEGDLSKAKIEIKDDEDTKIVTDSKEKIKSKYSIEYLKKMMTASKLSDSVLVAFNSDYPLKLEYKVVDKLVMSFILAPRVENE